MQIWVDADACPGETKELLFRAAIRTQIKITLVANQSMRVPNSEFVDALLVRDGANVADQRIVELLSAGDLVITADIPLAAQVVEKGGHALDPRGTLYSHQNVGDRLAARNISDERRAAGQLTRGPNAFTLKDRQAFANHLDRWLTAAKKQQAKP
jgi:uncharacterized protein YaiI (UPF0178 family)